MADNANDNAVENPTQKSGVKIYLKRTCPFCLKLRIFLTEAGIADRYTFVAFDDGDAVHEELRHRMEAADEEPSFPAVESESGKFTTGTDDLIARFAKEAAVDPAALPLLNYYNEGVFKQYIAMYKELRAAKSGDENMG